MNSNSVLLNNKDNVITALVNINANDYAYYFKDNECCKLFVTQNIPAYHKIALEDMDVSKIVIKYGEPIGSATSPIKLGGLVDHNNISSIQRNYNDEMVRC